MIYKGPSRPFCRRQVAGIQPTARHSRGTKPQNSTVDLGTSNVGTLAVAQVLGGWCYMREEAQMQGGVRTGPEHTHVCEDQVRSDNAARRYGLALAGYFLKSLSNARFIMLARFGRS